MKANELRIGNIINYHINKSYYQGIIRAIMDRCTIVTFYDTIYGGKNGIYKTIKWKVVDPIPLTEEWLTKFGFHKTAEDDFDKTFGDIDQISIRSNKLYVTDKFGVYLNPKRIAIIQYVHQLQNLYFALTGEELTIKK